MGKRVTTVYFCDRCGGKLDKVCGLIIEDLSFRVSGYDPRGSGTRLKGLEFCYSCSRQLYDWLNTRPVDPQISNGGA